MLDAFNIKEHKKTVIRSNNCLRSIEIGNSAIDNGFLLQFPGVSLAVFLYLVTHIDDNHVIETNPTIISTYLPDSYKLETIKEGLNYLKEHGIIEIAAEREGDYRYHIKLNISNSGEIIKKSEGGSIPENAPVLDNGQGLKCDYFNNREIRKKITSFARPSRSELFQAILTFIPPTENIAVLESTIHQWLEDFDSEMIKELIRRVDKWLDKYNNPPEKAFNYLKGILDDWYQKEIKNYQDLQYFDKLYRETRELANLYGLPKWHNVKPVHIETFNSWLKEGYPLSIELVKMAIKEAFQRKKDGQPSLQYIEENFIKPWKEVQVRDCQQARALLKKESSTQGKKRKKKKKSKEGIMGQWDRLAWDFED